MNKKKLILFVVSLILGVFAYSGIKNYRYKKGEAYYKEVIKYIKAKDVNKVIFNLEKAISLGYTDHHIYAMLGAMYHEKGIKDKEKKYYVLALEGYNYELNRLKDSKKSKILESYRNKGVDLIKDTEYLINDLKIKIKNLDN